MALQPADKKVLDAFLNRTSAEGKMLNTDGEVLFKYGLLSSAFALWELEHISVISPSSVPSDDVVMRALRKRLPEDLIRTNKTKPPDLIYEFSGSGLFSTKVLSLNAGSFSAFIPYKDYNHWAGSFDWGQMGRRIKLSNLTVDPKLNAYYVYRRMKDDFLSHLSTVADSYDLKSSIVSDKSIKF